jgi:putative holliday junction resolvase
MRGVRLGIDVGAVRVGVAMSDPDGILATPLVTLRRDAGGTRRDAGGTRRDGGGIRRDAGGTRHDADGTPPSDMAEIKRLIAEYQAVEVVIGLPVNLAGVEGPAARAVREYAQVLGELIEPVPIRLTDERMSTVVASRRLSDRGVRGRRQRAVIDQVAAVEILQAWLDARRRQT